MDKKTKQYLTVAVTSVTLFAALMNFSAVIGFAKRILGLILPILAGGILALFFSVPMNGIKKIINKIRVKIKKKPSEKSVHILSFVLTLTGAAIVLVLVITMLYPEIARSSKRLYAQIESNLSVRTFDILWLKELLSEINLERTIQHISDNFESFLPNVTDALSSTVGIVVNAAFAFIISVYVSVGSAGICNQARKLICAYMKPKHADNIIRFCRMFYRSFSQFLSGQCLEAVILGILMFASFTVFGLPYGSLVGILTAVCAIIPYVGAFISCGVSIFLTLLINPILAIRCAVVYLAVQFIENQFIYPRVVGESVGMPPLYTLIAAMLGAKLFGIMGILFFIPLVAVVIELVKEDANNRLSKTKITADDE